MAWRISLVSVLSLTCAIVPAVHVRGTRHKRLAAFAAFAGLVALVCTARPLSLSMLVGVVGVVGVALMALISGFGAVNTPYSNLAFFLSMNSSRHVDAQDIVDAEIRITHTLGTIIDMQSRLLELQSQSQIPTPTSFFQSVFSSINYKFGQCEILKQDIQAHQLILDRLFIDLDQLNLDMQRLREAKTLRGSFNNLLGYVFSGYCIFKMCMAAFNIAMNRHGSVNPVSQTLDILVHQIGLDIDTTFWSLQLSLAFLAVLVFVSIRGLLIHIQTVTRKASFIPLNTTVLFVSQVIACYSLTLVLMLRINLPDTHQSALQDVLGPIQFSLYQRWFDIIFLVSALASVFIIAAIERFKRRF